MHLHVTQGRAGGRAGGRAASRVRSLAGYTQQRALCGQACKSLTSERMVRNKMQLEMRDLAKLAKPQTEFQSQARTNDRACICRALLAASLARS